MKRKLKIGIGIATGCLAVAGAIFGPELWSAYRFFETVERQAEHSREAAGPWPRLQDSCALCHGVKGRARNEHYPSLAGLSADYLESQLRAFADGSRHHSQMTPLAASLSDKEIETLSAYYEDQRPVRNQEVDRGKKALELGKTLTRKNGCAGCHGEKFMGGAMGPRLAGQGRVYLIDQLEAYKEGSRRAPNQSMNGIAATLDSGQIAVVAGYLASLEPETP